MSESKQIRERLGWLLLWVFFLMVATCSIDNNLHVMKRDLDRIADALEQSIPAGDGR